MQNRPIDPVVIYVPEYDSNGNSVKLKRVVAQGT